jgi:hypothetical protein
MEINKINYSYESDLSCPPILQDEIPFVQDIQEIHHDHSQLHFPNTTLAPYSHAFQQAVTTQSNGE